MYGKTWKPCISLIVSPIEALFLSSSPAFDGLHNDIKIFIVRHLYRKLLTKNGPQGEREPSIHTCVIYYKDILMCDHIGNLLQRMHNLSIQ